MIIHKTEEKKIEGWRVEPYFLEYVCSLCVSRCQEQRNSGVLVECGCYRGVKFCNICTFRQEWMINMGTNVSKDLLRVFMLQIFLWNEEVFVQNWCRTARIIIISGTKFHSWIINVATEWLSAVVKTVHLDPDLTIYLSTSCANRLIISIPPSSARAVKVTVLLSALFLFSALTAKTTLCTSASLCWLVLAAAAPSLDAPWIKAEWFSTLALCLARKYCKWK